MRSANMLDGGGGTDLMAGRAGNDIYIVDNAGDVVIETAGQGIDEVRTSVSYALTAGRRRRDAAHHQRQRHRGHQPDRQRQRQSDHRQQRRQRHRRRRRRRSADRPRRQRPLLRRQCQRLHHRERRPGRDEVRTSVSYMLTAGADVETLAHHRRQRRGGDQSDRQRQRQLRPRQQRHQCDQRRRRQRRTDRSAAGRTRSCSTPRSMPRPMSTSSSTSASRTTRSGSTTRSSTGSPAGTLAANGSSSGRRRRMRTTTSSTTTPPARSVRHRRDRRAAAVQFAMPAALTSTSGGVTLATVAQGLANLLPARVAAATAMGRGGTASSSHGSRSPTSTSSSCDERHASCPGSSAQARTHSPCPPCSGIRRAIALRSDADADAKPQHSLAKSLSDHPFRARRDGLLCWRRDERLSTLRLVNHCLCAPAEFAACGARLHNGRSKRSNGPALGSRVPLSGKSMHRRGAGEQLEP